MGAARNPVFIETPLDLGVGVQEGVPFLENEAERKDFRKGQPKRHGAPFSLAPGPAAQMLLVLLALLATRLQLA